VLRDGEGLVGATLDRFSFFGQFLDMCPCCLQKKHHPSAMSHRFSSSLKGFRVFMASTSIAFGLWEEELPPMSALSKASLPLVPGSQVSLVTILWLEGEDGLLGEILS
jgi:hypothetical protein